MLSVYIDEREYIVQKAVRSYIEGLREKVKELEKTNIKLRSMLGGRLAEGEEMP